MFWRFTKSNKNNQEDLSQQVLFQRHCVINSLENHVNVVIYKYT